MLSRRRLLMTVASLVAVTCAVIWLGSDRLTAEEQPLVGTWRQHPVRRWLSETRFAPDHRFTQRFYLPDVRSFESTGRWWMRDGQVFMDFEPNPIRRSLRPFLERAGFEVRLLQVCEIADFKTDWPFGQDVFECVGAESAAGVSAPALGWSRPNFRLTRAVTTQSGRGRIRGGTSADRCGPPTIEPPLPQVLK
jgi:hypothetical protein